MILVEMAIFHFLPHVYLVPTLEFQHETDVRT